MIFIYNFSFILGLISSRIPTGNPNEKSLKKYTNLYTSLTSQINTAPVYPFPVFCEAVAPD